MVRSKLTAQNHQDLLRLYRQPGVTTTALAEQFQVSVSTIARILKENIPAREYQELVNLKRMAGRRKEDADEEPAQLSMIPSPESDPPAGAEQLSEDLQPDPILAGLLPEEVTADEQDHDPLPPEGDALDQEDYEVAAALEITADIAEELEEELRHELENTRLDRTDLEADLENDLDDDDLEEDDLESDEDIGSESVSAATGITQEPQPLQVLPLEELEPPRVCYAVVDRFQELATRPLREFIPLERTDLVDLGLSPETAAQARTLPIFDSHRVARRFSEMIKRGGNQPYKVIQFSGHLLEIVRFHLQGKGITHLLVDGRVYSL
jgi:hypothetical protein